jgi:hypothetical protein
MQGSRSTVGSTTKDGRPTHCALRKGWDTPRMVSRFVASQHEKAKDGASGCDFIESYLHSVGMTTVRSKLISPLSSRAKPRDLQFQCPSRRFRGLHPPSPLSSRVTEWPQAIFFAENRTRCSGSNPRNGPSGKVEGFSAPFPYRDCYRSSLFRFSQLASHSARNASTGLTDAARRAGTKHATPDTESNRAATPK